MILIPHIELFWKTKLDDFNPSNDVWLCNSFGYWLYISLRSTLESVVTLT